MFWLILLVELGPLVLPELRVQLVLQEPKVQPVMTDLKVLQELPGLLDLVAILESSMKELRY